MNSFEAAGPQEDERDTAQALGEEGGAPAGPAVQAQETAPGNGALCGSGDYSGKVAAVRKAVERRAAFGC
jgi:hypothetical protein